MGISNRLQCWFAAHSQGLRRGLVTPPGTDPCASRGIAQLQLAHFPPLSARCASSAFGGLECGSCGSRNLAFEAPLLLGSPRPNLFPKKTGSLIQRQHLSTSTKNSCASDSFAASNPATGADLEVDSDETSPATRDRKRAAADVVALLQAEDLEAPARQPQPFCDFLWVEVKAGQGGKPREGAFRFVRSLKACVFASLFKPLASQPLLWRCLRLSFEFCLWEKKGARAWVAFRLREGRGRSEKALDLEATEDVCFFAGVKTLAVSSPSHNASKRRLAATPLERVADFMPEIQWLK